MRHAISLFIIVLSAFAFLSSVRADPPNAIYANYDMHRQELNVRVEHWATKTKEHYVKEVVIYKNGDEVAKKMFTFQTSHREQTMPPLRIPAAPGDSFRIVATCSTGGSAETTATASGNHYIPR